MFKRLLDRKNDIKDFVDYVGKNEYLQTRQEDKREYGRTACYLRDIVDDIHYGVVRPINFIEEVYGDEFHKPVDKNPNVTHLQVRGKKRILLLYYEYVVEED